MTVTIDEKQEEFLRLLETDVSFELIDGGVVSKILPKFFHPVLTNDGMISDNLTPKLSSRFITVTY